MDTKNKPTSLGQLAVIEFERAEQISQYWKLLVEHELDYHLDDQPEGIIWGGFEGGTLPEKMLKIIKINHERISDFCRQKGLDVWDYIEL